MTGIIAQVVEMLGAIGVLKSIDPASEEEEAILEIEKHLSVGAERNSMILSAKCDAESPRSAQRAFDRLIGIYQSEPLRIHRNRHSGNFLSDQRICVLKCLQKQKSASRMGMLHSC